ncbi:hypothetical protein OS493_038419 [Desmophyllum pertusum]|uniref:Uncharacterized protein n=1 Tax=Desmophyllum pertusum TaxID=174260 RepID=A0A9W9ZYI4_9CNID|nr:hypothetical protein OS493_038419 [Desmophyllum pertusum]
MANPNCGFSRFNEFTGGFSGIYISLWAAAGNGKLSKPIPPQYFSDLTVKYELKHNNNPECNGLALITVINGDTLSVLLLCGFLVAIPPAFGIKCYRQSCLYGFYCFEDYGDDGFQCPSANDKCVTLDFAGEDANGPAKKKDAMHKPKKQSKAVENRKKKLMSDPVLRMHMLRLG